VPTTIDQTAVDQAVVHTANLTKVYPGGTKAVDALNLSLERGEIFGLLGPNGAGKTTTVGMLTTMVIPTSGQAWVGGVNVRDHPALAKQNIGLVSQNNTLDRSLTVWENLYFHGLLFGMSGKQARAEANHRLEQFRLAEWGSVPVLALSGGMAQRLMVARSILHHPAILFLDEPTAGLDPQSRLALWEILNELHDAGETILLTTHYMEEADQLCDRVAIMDHGHILALDSPVGLKRTVGADTIVTVDSEGDQDGLQQLLQGSIPTVTHAERRDGHIELQVHGSDGILPEVMSTAERGGYKVTDLSIAEPTLETVFITLTGKDLRD